MLRQEQKADSLLDNVKLSAEGPVAPPEGPGHSSTSPSPEGEKRESRLLQFEQEPPSWRELAAPDALSHLNKKDIMRQELINELFATEHGHIRMLCVLQEVFSQPLEREQLLTSEETAVIFPNLEDIIEMHYTFYDNMKKLRFDDKFIVKSISTIVLNRFAGLEREQFQKLTARFCSHQSSALEQIKTKQKKDSRFKAFIEDAESKPQCHRLQLKDIIPVEMQRLTKYPLLLEKISKNTEDPTEKEMVQQSTDYCRQILKHINEEIKATENLQNLKDYQRRLDTSGLKPCKELYTEYKNLDLTQQTMIFEGPLMWRLTNKKAIEVHCVLLGDRLVLLQKKKDKLVLKCQSKSTVPKGKQVVSPIIKLGSVLLRDVVTDPKAFFVMSTCESGAQLYELVAQSNGQKKEWSETITTTVNKLKRTGADITQLPPLSGGGGATAGFTAC